MSAERTLRRLERHIWELFGWRNRATATLEPWTVRTALGAVHELRIGDRWDHFDLPLRIETTIPEHAVSGSLLELFVEGDALVSFDGRLTGALSPFEREIEVGSARLIAIEVSPNDSFGLIGDHARLVVSRVVVPDT
ncbi:MAG TPA: hypothetical protein VHV31_00405, partial [Nitrolancea sp.]|nr:hypothetical protein [Nitrolancea sp.]